MDVFTQIFCHQPTLQIIVCQLCAIAIPPSQIATHLSTRHSQILATQRRLIVEAARTLPNLAWTPEALRLPGEVEQLIPGLKDRHDAFVCQTTGCYYTCVAIQSIMAHCKKAHGWVNHGKRGGDTRKKSQQRSPRP